MMDSTYVVDITAYDRVSVVKVKAATPEEAIAKACSCKNITVTIRAESPDVHA